MRYFCSALPSASGWLACTDIYPMIPARLSLPVQSMTGYAAASAGSPRGTLSLELRSVNARFLDVQFRIADDLRALEPVLREQITARPAGGRWGGRAAGGGPKARGGPRA